jgi:hypothetical protein
MDLEHEMAFPARIKCAKSGKKRQPWVRGERCARLQNTNDRRKKTSGREASWFFSTTKYLVQIAGTAPRVPTGRRTTQSTT